MKAPDINLVALRGSLATSPEVRTFDGGTQVLRLLMTVASDHPTRRIDVIPVVMWDPPATLVADLTASNPAKAPVRCWVVGAVQRRTMDGPEGRRSRIEVVASTILVIAE